MSQFVSLDGSISRVSVFQNDLLEDIDFISQFNLMPDDEVIIDECPLIGNCSYSNICNHIENGGWALIENNACGCNSIGEVNLKCDGVPECIVCGNMQVMALTNLYNSTNGELWTNNNGWLEDCNYCDWFGVTCDANQNVIGLNLSNNNLNGALPQSICQLVHLQDLLLGENSLSGQIPTCIGNMQALVRITLAANSFTGNIPDFLNTPNLISLQLAANQLSGNMPPSLGNLALQALSVSENNLMGCFDLNLMNLCIPQIFDLNITPGNNFDASWSDFCNFNSGACTTNIEDLNLAQIKLFPNPTTNNLTIESDAALYKSYQIFNSSGSLILLGDIKENKTKIDLNEISIGVYMIKMLGGQNNLIGKFIKHE